MKQLLSSGISSLKENELTLTFSEEETADGVWHVNGKLGKWAQLGNVAFEG